MPTVKDLMGSGIPALPASLLGGATTIDGNLTLTGTTVIQSNSADGADSYRLDITASGAYADASRGSYISMAGNENGSSGYITLGGGGTATSYINFTIGHASASIRFLNNSSALLLSCNNSGDLTFDATNGGNLIIARAGKGIQIKEGSNARMGITTLVAGVATVSNTSVTANTRVIWARQVTAGTPGNIGITLSAGANFAFTNSSATETSTVAWVLVEPAA